jgi:hypothetical protein
MPDPYPITLAGIRMDDTPDADGVRWRVFSVDGWDSAAVRIDTGDRTGRHGGYGSAPLWAARTLVVSGRAHCPDMATAFRVREVVAARLSCMTPESLVVHESVPKSLTVVCGGQPRSSSPIDAPPYRVTWQVTLRADDPFKRVLTPTVTPLGAHSSAFIASAGTVAADLLVTVTTAGAVALSAGGQTFYASALPVGAVIDTGAGTVRSAAGDDLFATVGAFSDWPALPPVGGTVAQAGTAGLSIVHHDTFS